MAAISDEGKEEYLVREVIKRNREDIEGSILMYKIMETMLSEGVISDRQYDQLKTHEQREGNIYAVTTFVDMVLRNDVNTSGFMNILKRKIPWEYEKIVDGTQKFKSGNWNFPGLEGNSLYCST